MPTNPCLLIRAHAAQRAIMCGRDAERGVSFVDFHKHHLQWQAVGSQKAAVRFSLRLVTLKRDHTG